MPRYATALSADPAKTYRSIDIGSRVSGGDPHQLVALLYEEAVSALRSAAWAAQHRDYARKSDRLTRSIAILFALEANLDHERGGGLSNTLATLYRGLRKQVVDASLADDPAPFLRAADDLAEVAGAWNQVRR